MSGRDDVLARLLDRQCVRRSGSVAPGHFSQGDVGTTFGVALFRAEGQQGLSDFGRDGHAVVMDVLSTVVTDDLMVDRVFFHRSGSPFSGMGWINAFRGGRSALPRRRMAVAFRPA